MSESRSRLGYGLRVTASLVCWALAVVVGLFSAGQIVFGGVACATVHAICPPPLLLVLGSVAVAVGFGIAGAMLWRPKRRALREPPPWDYQQ